MNPVRPPRRPSDPTVAAALESDDARRLMAELAAGRLPKPARRRPDPGPIRPLGVLLVHGIGDQRRGHTLTRFGEPLFACLRRWLRHHGGDATLTGVVLQAQPADERAPAHATARLHLDPDRDDPPAPDRDGRDPAPPDATTDEAADPGADATWVLAESNWADVFERPGFGSVAYWSIQVMPWMLLTQFADQLAEALRHGRLGRALFSFVYLVLTFPLALALQLAVFLLVPLSLIPPLRPAVAPIQRWISAVIGDTYVLLTSRFQFQSMVSTVVDDLTWLTERCDVVAVVAHSQGAAVAHEAVRQARHPKVERLITFGSAVSRLKALAYVTERARGLLLASSLITVAASLLAGLYLWYLLAGERTLGGAVLGLWSLGVLLAVSAYVMPFTLKGINAERHAQQDFDLDAGVEWDDYYASADPVPNGEMFATRHYTHASREVHNGANPFTDHSTYWDNQDEFGLAVTASLLRATGGRFGQQASGLLGGREVGERRARRTRYRVGARVLALLALVVALFEHPLLGEGLVVSDTLQLPLGWLATLGNWLISLAGDALGLVGSTLNLVEGPVALPTIPNPVARISWPVVVIAAVALWLALSGRILRWWEAVDTDDAFRSRWTWRSRRPPRAWWVAGGLLLTAWGTFWTTWLAVDPMALGAAVLDRLRPLWTSTRTVQDIGVPFFVYGIIEALRNAVATQRDMSRTLDKRLIDLADLGFGPRTRPDVPTVWGVIAEAFDDIVRGVGRRRFSGAWVAWIGTAAAIWAVVAALPFFQVQVVLVAALGLVALSCGVYGWVHATRPHARAAAAIGLLIGVPAMPVATAVRLTQDPTGPDGLGLLVAAAVALLCAASGAEALRRGWRTVTADARG